MQPDYKLTQQLLAAAAPGISPAILHGALTGHVCSGAAPDAGIFSDLFELTLPDVLLRLIERLGTEVRAALQQDDYGFQPLLPDDDSALSERLAALGQWCDWFNIGFAAGYMQPQTPLDVEVMEVLNDFGQLAEVEVPDTGSDDDETCFMELAEYVRMAAHAVFAQMQDATSNTAPPFNTDAGEAAPDERLLH